MALVDYFLKIDTVPGESKDFKHKDEIQLESWSFGAQNTGTSIFGGGLGAGKVQMQDFHFTCKMGKHTPKLLEVCSKGDHIANGTLTARKAGGEQVEYLVIKFKNLLVSSYQISGSMHDGVPNDACSFNFEEIELVYKEQTEKGTLGGQTRFGYNLKENKPK